jgi:hypothetical protein
MGPKACLYVFEERKIFCRCRESIIYPAAYAVYWLTCEMFLTEKVYTGTAVNYVGLYFIVSNASMCGLLTLWPLPS